MSNYTDLAALAATGELERIPDTEVGPAEAQIIMDAVFKAAAGTDSAAVLKLTPSDEATPPTVTIGVLP